MIKYVTDIVVGFYSILVSMTVTFRHLFNRSFTVQYPTEKMAVPERGLRRHILPVNRETNKLKCTACMACARICPSRCIFITAAGTGKERFPQEFIIDHTLCMYCRLCVESCNFDAIVMNGSYELADYTRESLKYNKLQLTEQI